MAKSGKNSSEELETTPQTNDVLAVENEELKNRLSKLEEMLLALTQKMLEKPVAPPSPIQQVAEPQDEIIPEIPMGKVIKVISLFNGGLNLKTSNDGSAQVYRFDELGQVLPIIYVDLVKILSNQRKFFTEGYCMVLDQNVVKSHALEESHKKMVDGKTIKNILTYDVNKINDILSGVMPTVQQTIIETVVAIINNNEYFDKKKVDVISSVTGKDIFAIAQRMK